MESKLHYQLLDSAQGSPQGQLVVAIMDGDTTAVRFDTTLSSRKLVQETGDTLVVSCTGLIP